MPARWVFNHPVPIILMVSTMARTLQQLGDTEVSELMHREISVFSPDDLVSKVKGELIDRTGRYEAAVVGAGKVGLVTVRDFLDVEQPEITKIEKFWRTQVQTPVTADSWVRGVAGEMVRLNQRAFPVVEGGKPAGIISQVDVVEALADCTQAAGTKAKDLTKLLPVTMEEGAKIAEARSAMIEGGFSHIPVTRDGRLVGMVTARDIIRYFPGDLGRRKVGELLGEKVGNFPGVLKSIMDENPLTYTVDSSALEVARGLRDMEKSAAIMVGEGGRVLGIITPRELLPLVAEPTEEEEMPISIVGLDGEGFLDRALAEEKVRRVISKGLLIHPHVEDVQVRIKKSDKGGERVRYQMTARVLSATEQFQARSEGYDLVKAFDSLMSALEREFVAVKHQYPKGQKRGRGRAQPS